METFSEDQITFSVNLEDASLIQLKFLEEISSHPKLFSGPFVKNAIRRYEQCWLPLAKEADELNVLWPPLDVYWVWYCHMLSPHNYESDCQRLIEKVPDHSLRTKEKRTSAMEKTKEVWLREFPEEPFELELDLDALPPQYEDNYQTRCQYDLESAAKRQGVFFYQVSLPHFLDKKFLKRGLLRYKQLLFLKKHNPKEFLVPCYDMDLIWHSHQAHPHLYKTETIAICGLYLNHDDSVNERSEGSKLVQSDLSTRTLWKETFNEEFSTAGAMYRGDPPSGKLTRVTGAQLYPMFNKQTRMRITKMNLTNFSFKGKFSIKGSLVEPRFDGLVPVFKVQGPETTWTSNLNWNRPGPLGQVDIDTRHESTLQFNLNKSNGFLCLKMSQVMGQANLPLKLLLNDVPPDGKSIQKNLMLEGENPDSAEGSASLDLHMSIDKVTKGNCVLKLQPGSFESAVMPEDVDALWGPIPLRRLPDDVTNVCSVASHR